MNKKEKYDGENPKLLKKKMKGDNEDKNGKIGKDRNIIYTLEKPIKVHQIWPKSNSRE